MANNKTKKTLQEHSEDALYREVWEEVRVQRFYDFMRKNIRIIASAAILVLAAVIVIQIVRHNRAENLKSETLAYESAMALASERQMDGAEVLLMRVAENSVGGMGDLAMFRAAQIDMNAGRNDEGIKKLEKLAKDGASRDFKHLALIKIAVSSAKNTDAKNFERTLAPLMTKRSPFYYTALLLVALRYADDGDAEAARNFAGKIVGDKSAPNVIAAQAEALIVYLQ